MPTKEEYARYKQKYLDKSRVEKSEIKDIQPLEKCLKKEELPIEYLQNLFPNSNVTENDVSEINNVLKCGNTERYGELLALCLEHKYILTDPDCPDIISYIEALKYISYLNVGNSFDEAYVKAKSRDKEIQELALNRTKENKDKLTHLAMMFSKSKLVIKLQKALDYPLHYIFGAYRYQAIEVLRNEMYSSHLSKDRIQAADRLLQHLSPIMEQANNIQININNNADKNIVDAYQEALDKIVQQKSKAIIECKDSVEDILNVQIKGEDYE